MKYPRWRERLARAHKELRQYNCYQYIWANEEVYSSSNNFELIEMLKLANGDLNKEIVMGHSTIKINER